MKVECGKPNENEAHAELMKKYDIKGYPTIIVLKAGDSRNMKAVAHRKILNLS
jgi:hypothetical protein